MVVDQEQTASSGGAHEDVGLDHNLPDERDASNAQNDRSNNPGGASATKDRDNYQAGSSSSISSRSGQPAAPDQHLGSNHVRHPLT